MKKVCDEKKCLEVKLWLEKKLMMKYKELILVLKTRFKFPLKKMHGKEEKRRNPFGCMLMD